MVKNDESRPKAAALSYEPGRHRAPVVTAKGLGRVAEMIVELARQHGVPVHEDADLVELLVRLDLHREIPPEAYVVVAEILAFVYRANGAYPSSSSSSS